MKLRTVSIHGWLAGATALLGLTAGASAQGLVATSGVLVATDGDAVPDANGVPIPNFTFAGSGLTGTPALAPDGNLCFVGRFLDSNGSTNTWNDRAVFYGSSRATLRMVARGGDQAPDLPAGVLLRTLTGSSSSIGNSVRMTADGRMWWGAQFSGGPVVSADDEAWFGGDLGQQQVLVRQGDAAPGTAGAIFAQAMASPQLATQGLNREGRVYFLGTLAGGDTTTTNGANNQVGIWSGMPGALELVVRKSGPVSGIPGAVAVDTFSTLANLCQMNDSGQLLYDVLLSPTQGTPLALASNNQAYLVHTPGAGSALLVREGDLAPGTASARFNSISGDTWTAGLSGNCWTRNGQTVFVTELRGGDVVGTTNDRAIYAGGTSGLTQVARKGSAAAGTDGNFFNYQATGALINANGRVAFQATLSGGTTTTANDTGIWTGPVGGLTLALREGQTMPGTGGSIAGAFSAGPLALNDLGQFVINVTLSGGGTPGASLWAWDPVGGLTALVLPNDQIEITPGNFRTVVNSALVGNNNADGAGLGFGHDGKVGVRVGFTGFLNALLTVQVPHACIPAAITGHPANVSNLCNGSEARFSVAVAHSTPATYQWLKNGVPLVDGGNVSGANALVLKISPALAGDAATYECVATTSCGPSVTSNPATLTLDTVDTDLDGTADCADGCPSDPLKTAPGVCGCGIADADTDLDGTLDCVDGCPTDPLKTAPGVCGCNVAEVDTDLDGVLDCEDGCPNDIDKVEPGQCGCGVADNDADNDGTADCVDGCPSDPLKIAPGTCGCGVADVDTDGDTTPDCLDGCPGDPTKIAPGICGCGVSDADTDLDGTADCIDGCPSDPLKTSPGTCGCGIADSDADNDGTADCIDGCPSDPLKTSPGACGCGIAETDTDGDATPDCVDGCPNDPLKTSPGPCGCGVAELDADADGVPDCIDNCASLANPAQADQDSDAVGDDCDNCPTFANANQGDCDGDGQGDTCEIANGVPDCNGNGVPDACDIASLASADLNANAIPDECETDGGTPYCFGYSNCPCGNNAVAGTGQGCVNSTGQGAMLTGAGLSSLSADGLVLTASNLPAGGGTGQALFFQGDAQTNVPFNDGRRCVSGSQVRLGILPHSTGSVSYPLVGGLPVSVAGSVAGPGARFYQVWYRNNQGPCGTLSSVSNGLAVIWIP